MPSVGMPSSKRPGSTRGAPSAYTDAGPPERTSAYGCRARTAAGLVEDPAQRPLGGDVSLDPLGDELLHVLDVALEVPVLRERASLHRAERPHPAVRLEALALLEDHLARALLDSGERRAQHDR